VVIPSSEIGRKDPFKYSDDILLSGHTKFDKYGPAGAIQLTGKREQDARADLGLKGKRNIEIWYFFGWASE